MKNKTYSVIAAQLLLVGLPARASWLGSIGTSLFSAVSSASQAFGFSAQSDHSDQPGSSEDSELAAAACPAPEPRRGFIASVKALFNRTRDQVQTGYRWAMIYLFGDGRGGPGNDPMGGAVRQPAMRSRIAPISGLLQRPAPSVVSDQRDDDDTVRVIIHPPPKKNSSNLGDSESVAIKINKAAAETGQSTILRHGLHVAIPEPDPKKEHKRWKKLKERRNSAGVTGSTSSVGSVLSVLPNKTLVETDTTEAREDKTVDDANHVTVDIPGPEEQEKEVQRTLIERLRQDVSTNQMERQGGTSVQSAPSIQTSRVTAKVNEAPDSANDSSNSQEVEALLEQLKNCVEGQASDRVYEQTQQHLYENRNQSDVKVFAETGKASVRVKKIADNVHGVSNKQEIIALLEQLKGRVETQVMAHNGDLANAQVVLNIPAPVDDSDSGRVLEVRKPAVDPHTYLMAAKRGLDQTLETIEQLIAEVKNPEFMTDQELKQYIERLERVSKTVLSLSQYWAPFEQFEATVKANTQKANRNNQGALLGLQSYYNYPIFNDGVDINSTASVIERVAQAIAAADRGKRSDSSVLRQIQYCLGEPVSKICYDRFVGGEKTWRNSQGSSEESASIIQKIQERMRQLEQAAIGARLIGNEETGTIAVDLGPGEATPERIFTSLYLLGAGLRRIKGEMDGGKWKTYAVIKELPQAPEEPKEQPLTLWQRVFRKAKPEPLTVQSYDVDSERATATEPSSAYLPYDLLRRRHREKSRRGGGGIRLPTGLLYGYEVEKATATAPLTAARLRLLESRTTFTR